MRDVVLLTPPVCEPVSLTDAKLHLRVDTTADDPLIASQITAARSQAEDYLRRALILQQWQLFMDSFPGFHPLYTARGYPDIFLPKPPFQRPVVVQYVDTTGTLQTLTEQTDYGQNQSLLYGYQVDPGSETQPCRLSPPWARPWPPVRLVERCVQISFWAGYCSAYDVNINGSPLGMDPAIVFNQADNDKSIFIPGAGKNSTLYQGTLTVNGSGVGTISPAPAQAVSDVIAFVGGFIPPQIIAAIKLQLAWLYSQRGDVFTGNKNAGDFAPGFEALLRPYRNLIA